jgi:SAM-dependent methyltransferase
MPHRFDDAARWAASFDAPERDAWQRPGEVIAALLDGRRDLVVADIGAGTGYFARRFAKALPEGQVIAVDVEPTLLDWIAQRAREDGLTRLTTHLSRPEGLMWGAPLPQIDLAFSCNTYHHIEARPRYFAEVRAALAPRGRLAIVDFTPDSPRGPPKHHKLPAETVIAELAEAGFRLVSRLSLLPDQYLLVFE